MIIEDLVKRVTETEISARESEALEKKITEIEARLNASLTKTTETEEKTGIYICVCVCVCVCMCVCVSSEVGCK